MEQHKPQIIEYNFFVGCYPSNPLIRRKKLTCNEHILSAGIPQTPLAPTGVPSGAGSVLLTLRTQASGRMPSGMFSFIVNFTHISSNMEGSIMLEASNYVDDQSQQFMIDGLMEGERYLFSAKAQNQFGSSPFSGNSDLIEAGTSKLCMCVCVCVCVCVFVCVTNLSSVWCA